MQTKTVCKQKYIVSIVDYLYFSINFTNPKSTLLQITLNKLQNIMQSDMKFLLMICNRVLNFVIIN
jgi:hypothetical protein